MSTHQPNHRPRPHLFPHLALALVSALSLAIASCDRRGKTAKAVEKSSIQLQAISDGVGPPSGEKFTLAQYNDVVETLKPLSDQGQPEENAAANVLSARAQIGLALRAADEASAQERDSLNRILVLRSRLASWIDANAAAAARDQFDPAKLILQAQQDSAEKVKSAEAMRQEKAKIDTQVADLRAQGEAKTAQAKTQEDQYATLKEQATKLTAIKAEPIIKKAADHRRAADRLRTEAQLLEARADQVAPQSAEAQLQIGQFENQKKNLDITATQLADRAQASKAEAAAARVQAAKIAADLDKAMEDLRTQRAGPLSEAFQDAVRQLQAASSTAQGAGSADPSAAKMTVGAAQQTLGDLHWSRAHGLESYRILLNTLAKAEPPLPQRAQYAKESEETAQARKVALQTAKDAYEAAQNAFSSVRAKGEAKERLDRLSAQLEKIVKYTAGESTDLDFTKPLPAPDDTTAATDTPAPAVAEAPAGPPVQLLAAIDRVFASVREKKYADLRALLYTPTPEATAAADNSIKFLTAFERIDRITATKFGQSLSEYAAEAAKKSDPTAPIAKIVVAFKAGITMGTGGGLKASDAKVTVTGDTAAAVFPSTPQPVTFHLVGGAWLMDTGIDRVPEQQRHAVAKAIPALTEGIQQVAKSVEAGTLQSNQAVLVSLLQHLQPILGELQQLGSPGRGGGG